MIGANVRMAPADVRDSDGRSILRRGLAWHNDGRLFLANGLPSDPQVRAVPVDGEPLRVGTGWKIDGYTVTSCGCSSPWKAVDPAPLEALAQEDA